MNSYSGHSGLLTDLYHLSMAAGYIETPFDGRATFELFVRSLPPRRSYLVAAGLEQALDYLQNVRFTADEIAYLQHHPAFRNISAQFFDYLAQFRFAGDVWAMLEGTMFFPGEPLLRVTAPITQAQIVETYLLATLNFQTLIASKAARVVTAARGRNVIEFGTRRAHGIESGVLAARAAYIGGCQGTSNVMAGHRFGIPTFGTQAHSWIMAHHEEEEAFRKFLEIFPDHAVLLVDTYDVRAAVEKIIVMGRKPRGVRLDSGDLAADSVWVRQRLDEAGWNDVEVFASGDLDEDRIGALLAGDGLGRGPAAVPRGPGPPARARGGPANGRRGRLSGALQLALGCPTRRGAPPRRAGRTYLKNGVRNGFAKCDLLGSGYAGRLHGGRREALCSGRREAHPQPGAAGERGSRAPRVSGFRRLRPYAGRRRVRTMAAALRSWHTGTRDHSRDAG